MTGVDREVRSRTPDGAVGPTPPSIGVVIPTHDRPELLRRALASVLAQDYPGRLRVVVVHDRSVPDHSLTGDRVAVVANDRAPGLAGARNTGILALDTDLVAFCDDDDVWEHDKLAAQVEALLAAPGAVLASCGIVVEHRGRDTVRLVGRERVTFDELVEDRVTALHSSSYLARRDELIDIGMVDEEIPGAQGEDWDLALRAAQRHPVVAVDRPLVRVLWGTTSFYARAWDTKVAALEWFLERYPEIRRNHRAAARVYGQIAFGHACLGRRGEAVRWCGRAFAADPRERRVLLALAVASGLVTGERLLLALHRYGRGV